MSQEGNSPSPTKRRGRPRNDESQKMRDVDVTIARTLYVLRSWGFTLRSGKAQVDQVGAAELVGCVARDVLGRSDHDGRPLGPDRIEQIFEAWWNDPNGFSAEPGGWRSADGTRAKVMPWSNVKVRSRNIKDGFGLIDRRPCWYPRGHEAGEATDEELVSELLSNQGRWPHGLPKHYGDDALTGNAHESWAKAPNGAWNATLLATTNAEDDSGKTG